MKHKTEIFDLLQYLYDTTGFSDHQLHCIVQFQNKVDAAVMEKAVRLLLQTVPALSRIYRSHGGKSYWEDVDPIVWRDSFTVVYTEADLERFTVSRINEEAGPQVKVCLLQSDSDTLSVVMSHMVTDGAGIKQCMLLLSDLYSNLLKNPLYSPTAIIDGDRGFQEILSPLGFIKKIKILLHNNKENNQTNPYKFPFSDDEKTTPFILTQEITPDKYQGIRNLSKQHRVTVNDVVLTAYFRVLSGMLGLQGKPLGFPIMIDMRRHLQDKRFNSLANLSSTVIIRTAVKPGELFTETLAKVSSEMNHKKNNYLGLNTFVKLDTLFKLTTRSMGFKLLSRSLKNPDICMTNIGILDAEKMIFEGSPIVNAYVSGSIKYRPHFQMSVSSFKDRMTFCVNLYGSSHDRETIKKFLALMDKELETALY